MILRTARVSHLGIRGGVLALLSALCLVMQSHAQSQLINGNRVIVGTLNTCATDTSVGDAYACALNPAILAPYITGTHFLFKAPNASTAAGGTTLNLNGIGAKSIVKVVGGLATALADNDIRAGQYVDVVYDSTADNFQMQSTLGNAATGSGDFSSNTVTSAVDEVVLFADTGGKMGKRATGSGLATLTSGVLGTVTAPASAVVGTTDTQTLTNKRVTQRVVSAGSDTATTFTPTADTADLNIKNNTQATGTLTIATPGGTPTDGQKLMFRIKCTNVQTYSWNAIYRGGTLPLATNCGSTTLKTDYLGFIYHATDAKWDFVSYATNY